MKKIIILQFIILQAFVMLAQVGIDEPNPDANAVMDIKAVQKGILLPRVSTQQRFDMLSQCTPNCPDALLVYDVDEHAFFYLVDNTWYCLNPFYSVQHNNGAPEDVATNNAVVGNIGIGTTDPQAKLDVNGSVLLKQDLSVGGTMNTGGNFAVNGTLTTQNLEANIINITGDLNIYDANNPSTKIYSSNPDISGVAGPIPSRGIVMWSGTVSSIPAGWALCDGNNGTPDLRDKMIVAGADPNTGGASYSPATHYSGNSSISWQAGTMDGNHIHKLGTIGDTYILDATNDTILSQHSNVEFNSNTGDNLPERGPRVSGANTFYTKSAKIDATQLNTGQNAHSHYIDGPTMNYYVLAFIMKL